MKKPALFIISILALILSASLFFFWLQKKESNTAGTNGDSQCVQEGKKSCGEAPVVHQCCPGLTMISAIDDRGGVTYDVAYCTKCGDGRCKTPENQYSCPSDCK